MELKGHDLSISTDVWATTDLKGMNVFFQELSSYRNPWQGTRMWAALEGEFEISATCTKLGHVIFFVKFAGQLGDTEEWKAQVRLETELGQLEKFARDANAFFDV